MKPRVGRPAGRRFWPATHWACLLLAALLALEGGRAANAFDFDLNTPLDENGLPMEEIGGAPGPLDELADEEDDAHQQSPSKRLKSDAGHVEQQQSSARGLWSRVRSSLPTYFDFAAFRANFKRNYKAAEAFLRKSIFLEKAVAVFKSRLAFRLGKKSYLENINKFSDLTADEFKLMYMASAPVEWSANKPLAAAQQEEAIGRRKKELEEMRRESYMPELASHGAGDEGSADDAPMSERRARQLIEQMLATELGERDFEEALAQELDGFGVETASQGADDTGASLPWPGRLKSSQVAADPEAAYEPPQLNGPEDALDWSKHQCLHQVYKQDQSCGNCYVMAATALVEFYKCTERGPERPIWQRKFSKDYVLHCAQKWTPHTAGCAGGSPLHTLQFLATAGIFNIKDWRVRRTEELKAAHEAGRLLDELDRLCPLSAERTPVERWGAVPVALNPKPVSAARWKEALQDGPLVASVQMPAEGVDSYASGVHDGAGCETTRAWHAMLLVGYGTDERGHRFWRFRNSFGPDWGQRGHFDLSMEVPGACLVGGVRVFREPLAP